MSLNDLINLIEDFTPLKIYVKENDYDSDLIFDGYSDEYFSSEICDMYKNNSVSLISLFDDTILIIIYE